MSKKMNFWDTKAKFRKRLSLKNRNILIIEHVSERYNISSSEAIEKCLEDPSVFEEAKIYLSKEYPYFCTRE